MRVEYGGSEILVNFSDTRATECKTPELKKKKSIVKSARMV
jgi:hypothetical protein